MSAKLSPPDHWEDWLAVSTDGFAAMNAGRPPAHLVKELVQNGLDAVDDGAGEVILAAQPVPGRAQILITCLDSGCGMTDLAQVRTVFHTSKTDSPLQRGRMGRGFKEMLCLANHATVTSGGQCLQFLKKGRRRFCNIEPAAETISGTRVQMGMPWTGEVVGDLERFFATFLPPVNVRLVINGNTIAHRPPKQAIEASLPTELYQDGRWIRPNRQTRVELIPLSPGEKATVYEMGIPVCPVEWTASYHANVLQRVPMNPGRDAVASGYLLKLHKHCLPALLPQMDEDSIRQDWVGVAAGQCQPEVQKEVIRLGFGENIARSVPKMGSRQFDEDARELGVSVVDTRQTSGGFRKMLQDHVPTTRQVVDRHEHVLLTAVAGGGFDPVTLDDAQDDQTRQRRKWIERAGGKDHVQRVMEFARWFCQQLLDGYVDSAICVVTVAPLREVNAVATWNSQDVLTLGIDTDWLWSDPVGPEALCTLIHESAHHLNAHHGRDFHKEVERLAGRAARLMFDQAQVIRQRFASLVK